jgi:hypothetical protein
LAEEDFLATMTSAHSESPTFDLPCRTVFAVGQAATEVIGSLLPAEAWAVHGGFWR